jgi:hypothetical protein
MRSAQLDQIAEGLDLVCMLAREGLRLVENCLRIDQFLGHEASPGRFGAMADAQEPPSCVEL